MTGTSLLFDASQLDRLACPVCLGRLSLGRDESLLICAGCQRAYPIIEGIPVLIAARAEQAAS
jgi:uncharacterized protein YbaR (Trm112 family)